jgi:hypothetical protein
MGVNQPGVVGQPGLVALDANHPDAVDQSGAATEASQPLTRETQPAALEEPITSTAPVRTTDKYVDADVDVDVQVDVDALEGESQTGPGMEPIAHTGIGFSCVDPGVDPQQYLGVGSSDVEPERPGVDPDLGMNRSGVNLGVDPGVDPQQDPGLDPERRQKGPAWVQWEAVPAGVDPKYWYQRYRFFEKFDEGVRLDNEMWYSVTPEALSQYQVCVIPYVT